VTAPIAAVELGRRAYGEVLALQRRLCRARVDGLLDQDLLLLVEHPPVVTLGRSTQATSLPIAPALLEARGLEVFEIERGGDVTLHAPGQLVGYPILHLEEHRTDLHWYLRSLEGALIAGLDRLGIAAERRAGLTGVWTAGRKIASIGVHVKRWVTLHGFALNVSTDLSLFDLIVPCGIAGVRMTSVAAETGRVTEIASLWNDTVGAVIDGFGRVFERAMVSAEPASLDRFLAP